MVAIEMRFTAGRFHATPWDRHVNEGAVEWPPSPWRLLRALLAVWHRKCPHLSEETVRGLIASLAEPLPHYRLPPATVGHTRHYMRQYHPPGMKKGQPGTAMVFDTFVAIDPETPVVICWPDLDLPADQDAALRELVRGLAYFGRAESWVEARVNPDWSGEANCAPVNGRAELPADVERVHLFAAQPPAEYAAWREPALERALETALAEKRADSNKPPAEVSLTKREREKCLAAFPEDLFGALHAVTTDLRRQGWNRPPGSRRVSYLLPARPLQARPRAAPPLTRRRPTVARFALAGSVLPRITDTVYLAETMRQALMAWSDGAAVFAGRDENGDPLQGHSHAFVLPADDDGDGRLDHITVYCRQGFDAAARRALAGVRRLWQPANRPDIHLVLMGLAEPDLYGGFDARQGQTPQLASSRVWVSRTSFVLYRYPRLHKDGTPRLRADGSWQDGPEEQVALSLRRGGFPAPLAIEPVEATEAAGRPLRWLQFARERRQGQPAPVNTRGYGFRLTFGEEVTGPLALGYACHFGLGQFVAQHPR
ncbi:MAG: type I-U CRISPR-associated protein Csb2 [Armatimonadota bacterium]